MQWFGVRMRSLALILSLVLSGVAPLGVVALESPKAEAQAAGCADCPGESEPGSCSPTCHDCVCSLGARTTTPPVVLLSAPALTPMGVVSAPLAKRTDPPREPSLDGVFHPPKQ